MAQLVRDRIPELIRASGRTPVIRTLSDDEYWAALDAKLDEEVAELRAADTRDAALEGGRHRHRGESASGNGIQHGVPPERRTDPQWIDVIDARAVGARVVDYPSSAPEETACQRLLTPRRRRGPPKGTEPCT